MKLFGIFRGRKEQTPELKEFPASGIYQEVKYRIDGDSVMLTSSSGKEIQFGPPIGSSDEFQRQKTEVTAGNREQMNLMEYRPSTFYHDSQGANAVLTSIPPDKLWGIKEAERAGLQEIGSQIMSHYYRSQAKLKK